MKPRCYREWSTYCSTELQCGRRPSFSRIRKYSFPPPFLPLLLSKRGLSSLTGTRSSFLTKVRIIIKFLGQFRIPKKYLELVGGSAHRYPSETAEGTVSTASKRCERVYIYISIEEHAGRRITRHDEWPGH